MITIQSISFENFKKFDRFSISCKETNILVGPNNAGKSTALDALRVFRDVHRYASRTSAILRDHESLGVCASYKLPQSLIGIPIENTVRDYGDDPAKIQVRLTNNAILHIWLHPNEPVRAFVQSEKALPRTSSDFRRLFPVNFVIVPTLSALEEHEVVVKPETAARNENTRLASGNFRNILLRKPKKEFEKFVELCKEGWDEIELERPMAVIGKPSYLTMMYSEHRVPRELYWSGFGFQVWMQMMAQFMRGDDNSILVLDEPDIYLHPELQRRVLRMAKERFGQVFIATHSTEIMNEADPGDIISVSPENRVAVRVTTDENYRKIYSYLGSSENAEFARLARADRIIFFEGKERILIRKFANKSRADAIFQSSKTVYLQAGGFSQWRRVREVDWALHNIFRLDAKVAALFDRDYRCDEEIDKFKADLKNDGLWVDVLGRKEIENYALVKRPLISAIHKRLSAKGIEVSIDEVDTLVSSLTKRFQSHCQAQFLAHYLAYHREANRHIAEATHLARANERFELGWAELDGRLKMLPGKEFVAVLSTQLQKDFGASVTVNQIADEMDSHEVPTELVAKLTDMASFFDS